MTTFQNSFEGGVDTVVIDPTNSGGASGDAFTAVSTGGNEPTFSTSSPLNGAVSALFTATTIRFVAYDDGAPSADFAGRFYFSIPANPSVLLQLVQDRTTGAAPAGQGSINVTTGGQVTSTCGTTTSSAAGATLAFNTRYRCEWQCTGYNSGSATKQTQIYVGDNTGTPHITISQTGITTTGNQVQRWRIGYVAGTVAAGVKIDDIKIVSGSSTAIGPSLVPVAVAATAKLGGTAYVAAAKAAPAAGSAAAGVTPLDIARKNSTPTGRALAGLVARDAAAKLTPAAGTAAAGVASAGGARKAAAAAGRAAVGLAAIGTLSAAGARAVTGRVLAGLAGVGAARKASTATARGQLGVVPASTARKATPATATTAAGVTARSTTRRVTAAVSRAAAGITTAGAGRRRVAAVGRAVVGFTSRRFVETRRRGTLRSTGSRPARVVGIRRIDE